MCSGCTDGGHVESKAFAVVIVTTCLSGALLVGCASSPSAGPTSALTTPTLPTSTAPVTPSESPSAKPSSPARPTNKGISESCKYFPFIGPTMLKQYMDEPDNEFLESGAYDALASLEEWGYKAASWLAQSDVPEKDPLRDSAIFFRRQFMPDATKNYTISVGKVEQYLEYALIAQQECESY